MERNEGMKFMTLRVLSQMIQTRVEKDLRQKCQRR